MKRVAIFVFAALCGAAASAKPDSGLAVPIITTSDPGKPYVIIDGACFNATYTPVAAGDGFGPTLNSVMKQASDVAKQQGADAIIGMNVTWEGPNTLTHKGRVVMCGTLVRLK